MSGYFFTIFETGLNLRQANYLESMLIFLTQNYGMMLAQIE